MRFDRAEETDKVSLISLLPPIDSMFDILLGLQPPFYPAQMNSLLINSVPTLARYLLRVTLPIYV